MLSQGPGFYPPASAIQSHFILNSQWKQAVCRWAILACSLIRRNLS